jgi:hypothetical protein
VIDTPFDITIAAASSTILATRDWLEPKRSAAKVSPIPLSPNVSMNR